MVTLLTEAHKTVVVQDPVATGAAARKLRLSIPLGIRETSARIGLSQAQISRLENGVQKWEPHWIAMYNSLLTDPTPAEYVEILRFMLGAGKKAKRRGSRNHFITTPFGPKFFNLCDMQKAGLVDCAVNVIEARQQIPDQNICFWATRKGCHFIGLNDTEVRRALGAI